MKKISALAALTMAGLAIATPAHADNDSNVGRGTKATTHQNPLAASLCKQALALVPVAAAWTGTELEDACNNRDHKER